MEQFPFVLERLPQPNLNLGLISHLEYKLEILHELGVYTYYGYTIQTHTHISNPF